MTNYPTVGFSQIDEFSNRRPRVGSQGYALQGDIANFTSHLRAIGARKESDGPGVSQSGVNSQTCRGKSSTIDVTQKVLFKSMLLGGFAHKSHPQSALCESRSDAFKASKVFNIQNGRCLKRRRLQAANGSATNRKIFHLAVHGAFVGWNK